MRDRYIADCVTHACRLAELLLAEGRSPSIVRLREVIIDGDRLFHGPLIPKRFPALTWTTHYACCCGGEVYDPIAGIPIAIEPYAMAVFGRELPVAMHFDAETTARLVMNGELAASFRPTRAT